MKTRRIGIFSLFTIAILVVLAACSGAGTGSVFTVTQVNPDIAQPGGVVTVTGTELANVKVTLAGMPITPEQQSESAIVFSVPMGVPGGPQPLEFTFAGRTVTRELFVGIEFLTGTLEDLAVLNLPAGSAVRFGPGVFSSSGMVVLEHIGLYGAGKDETILNLAPLADSQETPLVLVAYPGMQLGISDLTIRLGGFAVIDAYTSADFSVQSVGPQVVEEPVIFTRVYFEESSHGDRHKIWFGNDPHHLIMGAVIRDSNLISKP